MTPRRTLLSLTAAAGLIVSASACASGPAKQPRATIVTVQASDGGGAADAGGAEETAGGPAVIPGDLDLSTVTDACSTEGMIKVTATGAEPALKSDGEPVIITYKGPKDVDGLAAAVFVVDEGDGKKTMEPASLGDKFTIAGHTYAVSSVCGDNAELDVVE